MKSHRNRNWWSRAVARAQTASAIESHLTREFLSQRLGGRIGKEFLDLNLARLSRPVCTEAIDYENSLGRGEIKAPVRRKTHSRAFQS